MLNNEKYTENKTSLYLQIEKEINMTRKKKKK